MCGLCGILTICMWVFGIHIGYFFSWKTGNKWWYHNLRYTVYICIESLFAFGFAKICKAQFSTPFLCYKKWTIIIKILTKIQVATC